MVAAQLLDIHGAKGGSDKPKTPTEAPDSLRSIALAKMLIAVGEGEFDGIPTAKNIYLDNTPLQDEQGNFNFPNVKWEWRTGSVEQPYIPGISSVENETTLGIELRSCTPWVRSINNKHPAVRGTPALCLAHAAIDRQERKYQRLPDRVQGRGGHGWRRLSAGVVRGSGRQNHQHLRAHPAR